MENVVFGASVTDELGLRNLAEGAEIEGESDEGEPGQ
jgi:hypothetical protein